MTFVTTDMMGTRNVNQIKYLNVYSLQDVKPKLVFLMNLVEKHFYIHHVL